MWGDKSIDFHVLHGTAYDVEPGTVIGYYRIHYSDGTEEEIPFKYGDDLLDWHYLPGQPYDASNSSIAWVGHNRRTRASPRRSSTATFQERCDSRPRADVAIDSIDYVSAETKCNPFLIAVTVDRNEDPMAMYVASNEQAVANSKSDPSNEQYRAALLDSWQHLSEASSDAELSRAYRELAFAFEVAGLTTTRIESKKIPLDDKRATLVLDNGSEWRYWDQGGLPDAAWFASDFDDLQWKQGKAPLGYGEPGLADDARVWRQCHAEAPGHIFSKDLRGRADRQHDSLSTLDYGR